MEKAEKVSTACFCPFPSSDRTNISHTQVRTFMSTCINRLLFRMRCLLLRIRRHRLHFPLSSSMVRICKNPLQITTMGPRGFSRKPAYDYAQHVIAFIAQGAISTQRAHPPPKIWICPKYAFSNGGASAHRLPLVR